LREFAAGPKERGESYGGAMGTSRIYRKNLVAIVYHGMETPVLAGGGHDLRGHRELLATIGDMIERFENA
jgi:hypothetical protein